MERKCPICGGAGVCSNFYDLSKTLSVACTCPACDLLGSLGEEQMLALSQPGVTEKLAATVTKLAEEGCFSVEQEKEIEELLNELRAMRFDIAG